MYMAEFFFALFLFIPNGESPQISSSGITKSLIFWSSCLGLDIIDGDMNQFSWKISREEGEIHVGKVDLCFDARYRSE